MPAILTGACIRQYLATGCGQREHVVQLAICQQSAIGGDRRAAELDHQAPVEIEPQRAPIRFTRRVPHWLPRSICDKTLNIIPKSEQARSKSRLYPGNVGSNCHERRRQIMELA